MLKYPIPSCHYLNQETAKVAGSTRFLKIDRAKPEPGKILGVILSILQRILSILSPFAFSIGAMPADLQAR
ncbi:hypothetical protein SFPGR_27150 [Sulfuriferula plumbiphila]|nr:hypothetical protein SFPGR_27150 [Sulfuriferula plumbiphila]